MGAVVVGAALGTAGVVAMAAAMAAAEAETAIVIRIPISMIFVALPQDCNANQIT